MKRSLPIFVLLLLSIAVFFGYHHFSIKPQNDLWDESKYQQYEPLCVVDVPLFINDPSQESAKVSYIMWQNTLHPLVPKDILGGSRTGAAQKDIYDDAISFQFEKKCPTVFNYYLLFDLYPDHVRDPFFEYNPNFEEQSTAAELSSQQCELTVSLPNIYEQFQERLTQYLKLHLKSFVDITATNTSDGSSISAQLLFNSACDQVLADYLMQDLLPADYYQMIDN